jgi:glycosyltransferase involved in cell wall biosynthesis
MLKEDKGIQFLLGGLGRTESDEEQIRSQIDEYGLGDKVKLLGYIEGQAKIDAFGSSHIFVLPSHTEVFPVTIVEAMAAAMPVIATPVGAVPEIIEVGVNGFIVPLGDYQALAEKIRYLAQHPGKVLEMGQNNLQKFRCEYEAEICAEIIDGIYQSLK